MAPGTMGAGAGIALVSRRAWRRWLAARAAALRWAAMTPAGHKLEAPKGPENGDGPAEDRPDRENTTTAGGSHDGNSNAGP